MNNVWHRATVAKFRADQKHEFAKCDLNQRDGFGWGKGMKTSQGNFQKPVALNNKLLFILKTPGLFMEYSKYKGSSYLITNYIVTAFSWLKGEGLDFD